MTMNRAAHAPGRVNLVGDHTDYNDGLALPMAIDLGTDAVFTATGGDRVHCVSTNFSSAADLPVSMGAVPEVLRALEPPWTRLAASVISQAAPWQGGVLRISSDLPMNAGLSSSAAFVVATALALGVDIEARPMAFFCQRAEELAGSSVGLMDPLVCMEGVAGHALLIDFSTLDTDPVPLPGGVEVVVVNSGVDRHLAGSPYAARRAECEAAASALGCPLGRADDADVAGLTDPVLRRRARHVVTECLRVRATAAAFRRGDLDAAGQLLDDSHRSLRDDFESSVPAVDALVEELRVVPGVYGARMTGGGFGGCVVALSAPGAVDLADPRWGGRAQRVTAGDGARVIGADGADLSPRKGVQPTPG